MQTFYSSFEETERGIIPELKAAKRSEFRNFDRLVERFHSSNRLTVLPTASLRGYSIIGSGSRFRNESEPKVNPTHSRHAY